LLEVDSEAVIQIDLGWAVRMLIWQPSLALVLRTSMTPGAVMMSASVVSSRSMRWRAWVASADPALDGLGVDLKAGGESSGSRYVLTSAVLSCSASPMSLTGLGGIG
jgi:hypothetical protein